MTLTPMIPTVFESFNARALRPEQVAQTFVAPKFFRELASRCHSTIIGPRGSGKTSLLKMLQPRALESWKSEEADEFRAIIDFTGVFIPTDISWNKQTIACVDELPKSISRKIRTAAFTTQVLHAIVETLCWRTEPVSENVHTPFRRVTLSDPQETLIVKELASTWKLSPTTQTLVGLKHSLSRRNTEIWSLAQDASFDSASKDLPDWISLEFLSCATFAFELFDDTIGQPDSRWALLFDELELAPQWIMDGLITALRSSTPRILFKLALSPFDEHFSAVRDGLSASPQQDFNEIVLWQAKKDDNREFATRLFLSACNDQGRTINQLEDLVGASQFDRERDDSPSYSKGSSHWKQISQALLSDPSFALHWSGLGIDIDTLSELPEPERAAKVRKIYPLIVLRNFFRAAAGSAQIRQQVRKGRKSIDIYSGANSLLAISEGNPRWIIGITRLLLSSTRSEPRLPISKRTQSAILEDTMHKFRARIKSISVGPSRKPERMATLLSLIDSIGTYFGRHLIDNDFTPQPPLTFTVDLGATPELIAGIGRAVNAGAIVYIPEPDSSALIDDLTGKRFRLSYLLAPYFRLPLRLGETVALSTILRSFDRNPDPLSLELPLLENY